MAFSSFASAYASTAPKLVTPKKFIHNIVTENNFETLFWMLAGRKMSDMLRGGSEVRARVKFSSGSQADNYDIGVTEFDPALSQDGDTAVSYWHGHMAYDSHRDEILDINSGGTGMDDTIEETWTQEIYNMWQSLYTALHKSFSYGFWRPPDPTNMGGSGQKYQASIPYIVNEHLGYPATHGGANSVGTGYYGLYNTGSTQFRTIFGIDVPNKPGFVPYVKTYGASNTGFTANVITNVIYSLDMAVRKTTFKAPPVSRQYFDKEEETAIDKSGGAIFASAIGVSGLETLYRSSQDRWNDWMDPFGQPRFKGIPVVYERQLDTAPIYVGGTKTEAGATITGPRYTGLNAKRARCYWHKNRFMKVLPPINDRRNPTLWAHYINSLMTVLSEDRSKHFLITPADSQTSVMAA